MNQTRQPNAGRERGAALIVAIGVLTLLLVIALTFFRASIGDVRTAQNTVDGVRAELLADGATAVAIAFLNHDRYIHPTYTSLDHAWRSYFNGTFAAGKPYMWATLEDPIAANGVHRQSLLRDSVVDANGERVDRAGIIEIDPTRLLPVGPSDSMYIPRMDVAIVPPIGFAPGTQPLDYTSLDVNGALQNPFIVTSELADPTNSRKFSPLEAIITDPRLFGSVTFQADIDALQTTVYDDLAPNGRAISLAATGDGRDRTLPYEQIHFINDVDNNGDGLNDSMWIPVGADRYYPEDGLDNDLDGYIDAADPDGEPGVFMYRGDTDGLDNDGDGLVDEHDPDNPYDPDGEYQYVIFTVPAPWQIDLDGNGTLDPVLPTTAEYTTMGITGSDQLRFEGQISPVTGMPVPIGYGRLGNEITSRDNDYDLVLDSPSDASRYMLTPGVVAALANGDDVGCPNPALNCAPYRELLMNLFALDEFNTPIIIDTDGSVALAGLIQAETMTELRGRMAILITDESSKVNINAAGGWQYPVFPDPANPPTTGQLLEIADEDTALPTPFQRSFADGIGPHEFDTRVIPDIGSARARWMWQFLMGAREGYFSQDPRTPNAFLYHSFEYEGDATLPGYGYVDDNANLLQLALSRNNNRGGPDYYIGPFENPVDVLDPTIDLGLIGLKWDGIDEPGEYQHFRPYRNVVAESTDDDNDGDDIVDEIGELGDLYYRTHQQLKLINAGTSVTGFTSGLNDDGEFNALRNYVSVHSTDRNERHFHQDPVLATFMDSQSRQTTGQRKDLNLTRSGDVARAAKRDWTFSASVAEAWTVAGALMAQRGVLGLRSDAINFGVGALDPMPAGGDTRDFLLGMRQEHTTVFTQNRIMDYDPGSDVNGNALAFTLLADPELRIHQVSATLKDFADLDYTRSNDDVYIDDFWWQRVSAQFLNDPDTAVRDAARLAQSQRIYHAVAGLEAIRINELMVRPVRRFEAESITDIDVTLGVNEPDRGLYPNRFTPGLLLNGNAMSVAEREEQGFRLRVTTTTDAVEDYELRSGRSLDFILTPTSDDEAAPVGERWNLRPLIAVDGTVATDAGLLGLEAAWATYRRYVTLTDPDIENSRYTVPDVVQFSIQATEGLPAGRYYLLVNTQYTVGGEVRESVDEESDLLFAVKTGTLEQDWFADVMNIDSYANIAGTAQIYNLAWRTPALLGSEAMGGSAGMAFLQGDAVFDFDESLPAGQLYTTTIEQFSQNNVLDERNLGFTIEVPERDYTLDPEDDRWIHIAFRRGFGSEDDRGLVINYLEFSQEPDHEWLEIVNQSDDVVDVSGWELAVEAHPLGIGPMRIPENTFIAPRGMLLLGTNKFDWGYNVGSDGNQLVVGDDVDLPANRDIEDRGLGFFVNGIGLVTDEFSRASSVGVLAGITVPQFPQFPAVGFAAGEGSVFFREDGADFVDSNGNGISDFVEDMRGANGTLDVAEGLLTIPDADVRSTVDPTAISGPLPQGASKAWDRIVELDIPDLVPQLANSNFGPRDIGRIVLGGGIFPNRPEFDATDNDGDSRPLVFDSIDNDGDGEIDEPFEGFNEGRYAREQYRIDGTAVPGAFNDAIARFNSRFLDTDDVMPAFWDGGATELNPAKWKEFMERRNFPGDNVIVTLYEGPAPDEATPLARIADRVTYTQRDVDNRQIDDVIFVTDFDVETNAQDSDNPTQDIPFGETNVGDVGVVDPLDFRYESFWPENTMGQDFARSLERKHPDYTGDRFGFINRFQATDGNYDDWSESTGRWVRIMALDSDGVLQNAILEDRALAPVYRHTFNGTPLRQNVTARNARIDDSGTVDVLGNPIPLFFGVNSPALRDSTFSVSNFRNRPLVSPGDAMTMPYFTRHELAAATLVTQVTTENYLFDPASPNIRFTNDREGTGDITVDSVVFGQRFDDSPVVNAINYFHPVRAIVGDVGTTDSVSLNVGQASVIQVLRPGAASLDPIGLEWDAVTFGRPPQNWAPLLMFELGDDNVTGLVEYYNYERRYLFQPLASLPTMVDNARWPMRQRAALYASRNYTNFGAGDPLDGAQAVFVWDGEDGLENGEYDLYIVTTEDLSLLRQADDDLFNDDPDDATDPFDQRLLTDIPVPTGFTEGIGAPFVRVASGTANNEVYFDIEVLRDANGDRKAWRPDLDLAAGDVLIADSELNRAQTSERPAESFGVLRNAQPDADGVIRYGNVRVENNFLAVSIRNRSAAGSVARISRVVLTARGKTPGRININTVETKRFNVPDLDDPVSPSNPSDPSAYVYFYNPISGIPGVLDRYPDDAAIGPLTMVTDEGDGLGFVTDADLVNTINSIETDNDLSSQIFAQRIVEQRLRLMREHPDGRYYELTSDLLSDAHVAFQAEHPSPLVTGGALHLPLVVEYDHYLPDVDANGAADASAIRAGALREAAFRFGKMQNLITTKSEVFEILVTVQSGYGTDANGDGRINWRDDREFTSMAEKTARTIYER